VTVSVQASVLSHCRIESNRIEKSIRQRKSNRIELFDPESECSSHRRTAVLRQP